MFDKCENIELYKGTKGYVGNSHVGRYEPKIDCLSGNPESRAQDKCWKKFDFELLFRFMPPFPLQKVEYNVECRV